MDNLYAPQGEIFQLNREAHASKVVENFDVGNISSNLHRYV